MTDATREMGRGEARGLCLFIGQIDPWMDGLVATRRWTGGRGKLVDGNVINSIVAKAALVVRSDRHLVDGDSPLAMSVMSGGPE